MVGTVIDRGGEVAADTVPPSEADSPVARSGGWGNIAVIGAGIGLLGAVGGIAIGYGAFHHPASASAAAPPAKASDRAVDDVMGSPNAQRAALAGQLGQPGAPQTDVFGRPIVGAPVAQVPQGIVIGLNCWASLRGLERPARVLEVTVRSILQKRAVQAAPALSPALLASLAWSASAA